MKSDGFFEFIQGCRYHKKKHKIRFAHDMNAKIDFTERSSIQFNSYKRKMYSTTVFRLNIKD